MDRASSRTPAFAGVTAKDSHTLPLDMDTLRDFLLTQPFDIIIDTDTLALICWNTIMCLAEDLLSQALQSGHAVRLLGAG